MEKSNLSIPPEWEEKFIIKRINESDILINLDERNAILEALNDGQKFIQIGKYTLMLNAIKSINPRYEPDNIPPRPKLNYYMGTQFDKKRQVFIEHNSTKPINQDEVDLWDKLYKNLKTEDKGYYLL